MEKEFETRRAEALDELAETQTTPTVEQLEELRQYCKEDEVNGFFVVGFLRVDDESVVSIICDKLDLGDKSCYVDNMLSILEFNGFSDLEFAKVESYTWNEERRGYVNSEAQDYALDMMEGGYVGVIFCQGAVLLIKEFNCDFQADYYDKATMQSRCYETDVDVICIDDVQGVPGLSFALGM